MNKFLKPAVFFRAPVVLVFVILCFSSCKKETSAVTNQGEGEAAATSLQQPVPEKVDRVLLNTYINYQVKAEASLLLYKEGVPGSKTLSPKMGRKEFDAMIANYLANERNMLLANSFLKPQQAKGKHITINSLGGEEITNDDDDNGRTFSGTGSFPGSTITSIVFAGSISNNGTISQQNFSFGGVHGTIATVGPLSQSVHNGVTTYQQNFSETVSANGVTYTQNFVVYGNIYNSTVTVTGMQTPPPSNN